MSGRLIDLSVAVEETTQMPPSSNLRIDLTRHFIGPEFLQITAVSQSLHTGSHIDAPLHVEEGGPATADIPLDRVCGRARMVDCTGVGSNDPVDVPHLEARARDVRSDEILVLRTDWSEHAWGRFPDYYTRSPFLTPDAAEWIAARSPKAVAFDFFEEYCARLPDFSSDQFVCHRILLGAGIPLLEQVTNLSSVGTDRFQFYAPFYKLTGCDGALARFFAVV